MMVVKICNSMTSVIRGSGFRSCLEQHGVRWMVTKATNRSAVHGSRLPAQDSIDKSVVEDDIKKGKQQNEEMRKKVKDVVDSKTSNLSKDNEQH